VVNQEQINSVRREALTQKQTIDALAKIVITLEKQNKERGKSLNKLWEKGKQLMKDIVEIKKYCGKLTYDVARLHLENRIIISTRVIGCENKQFLVKDIVRQLINESDFDLEFKILQRKVLAPKIEQ
jgi:hypothetical protein